MTNRSMTVPNNQTLTQSPNPPDDAVIFRGDGEPISPQLLSNCLASIVDSVGISPDNYSKGGTISELESRFADILGKETSIFMPTGTLANHLAIRTLCGDKPRAIVQEQSHLYNDTGDSTTRLSGINLVPLAKDLPCFTVDDVKSIIHKSEGGRVSNQVGALLIESPVRRQMGQVMSFDDMKEVTSLCQEHGIGTHLDGARIYMMSAASGIDIKKYCELFDTVYVSLYKYFGAPFGAILAGSHTVIDNMFHDRRMFGGGLAGAYPAAALALHGVEGFEQRFTQSIKKGRDLFRNLNLISGIEIKEFELGSNIFPLSFDPDIDIAKIAFELQECGIYIYPEEGSERYSQLTVNTTILRKTNAQIVQTFRETLGHL